MTEVHPQDYYGTKRVTAWPEERNGKPGYGVKYRDGYVSWSPASEFEAAYQPLHALSFGHALVAMKAGHRVTQDGWDGNYLKLIRLSHNDAGQVIGCFNGDADSDDWEECFDFETQELLANNWQILQENLPIKEP